jgi:hypothetical protein
MEQNKVFYADSTGNVGTEENFVTQNSDSDTDTEADIFNEKYQDKYNFVNGKYICKCCEKETSFMILEHHWKSHMTTILSSLFLGAYNSASSLEELKYFGITDIVNVARELRNKFPEKFSYYDLLFDDDVNQRITAYLDDTVDYIHMLISNNCKVFVHCYMGVSRSASIVIAYLIKYNYMTYDEAFKFVSEKRYVKPNKGFEKELREFSKKYEDLRNIFMY